MKAGGSKTVTLTFSPVDTITYRGKVTVTSNKTSGKKTIPVSGTGTTPTPEPAPTPDPGPTCDALAGMSAGCPPAPAPTPDPAAEATPHAIFDHGYYCDAGFPKPQQSGVEIAISEIGGTIGMTVTSIHILLYSVDSTQPGLGPLEVDKTLSAAEIAAQWGGSNYIGAGDTRLIKYQSHFPSGKFPEDGNARAFVEVTDDNGNTFTLVSGIMDQMDKC